jgi:hypothetical protein
MRTTHGFEVGGVFNPAPFFVPETDFEVAGFVPNVVYPTGVAHDGDSLLIFYGAADTSTAVADATVLAAMTLMYALTWFVSDGAVAPSAPPRYMCQAKISLTPHHGSLQVGQAEVTASVVVRQFFVVNSVATVQTWITVAGCVSSRPAGVFSPYASS